MLFIYPNQKLKFAGFYMRLRYLFFILLATVLFASCSKYQKLLKSSNMEEKYLAAVKYYDKGEYYRALSLFEELTTVYRGTAKAERVYYYYAYCHYYQEEYEVASFHFDNYAKTFSTSQYAEECQFMAAYCHYLQSPTVTLDQESTVKAINELQLFINKYPQSAKVAQCNDLIDMLREKLQLKDFLNAKLYYKIGDNKAAIRALNNVIKEWPETKYKEDCLYLITKANFILANNSVDDKKEERYKATIEAYYKLVDNFPQSKYLKETEQYYQESQKLADQYKLSN